MEPSLIEAACRVFLNNTRESVIITDSAGNIVFWNDGATAVFGYEAAEMLGRTPEILYDAKPVADMTTDLNKIAAGDSFVDVWKGRTKNGSTVWVDIQTISIPGENGSVAGYVGMARDITSRWLTLEETRRTAEELNDFFENAAIGIHWVGPDGRILKANRAELQLLGYTAEEYIGRHIADFHADSDVIKDILNRLRRNETLQDYPARMIAKDGSLRYVLISSNVYMENGQFIHTRCFTRDMTGYTIEKDKAHLYRKIFQSSNEGIAILDLNGRYIEQNAAYRELTEFQDSDLENATPAIHMGEQEFGNVIQKLAENGTYRGEFKSTTSSGKTKFIDSSAFSVKDDAGNAMCLVGINRDISERKKLELDLKQLYETEKRLRVEAEQANLAKDQFLATLSHELRTPLTSMLGWSNMLQSHTLESGMVAKAIESIRRNARLQTQLIDDLLDVSRIITGKLQLEVAPLNFSRIVEDVLEEFRPQISTKKIRLNASISKDLIVNGDRLRLQQVISNLISNAIKFTPEKEKINITAVARNKDVQLSIQDTGIGISPEFIPNVFERFRQADGSITRRHGGLGLGLSIAHKLAQMHGGNIKAESGGLGQGSTFTLSLPRVVMDDLLHDKSDASAMHPDGSLKGLKILVVEDDKDTREMISFILRQWNSEVHAVSSVREAIKDVDLWKPDLLISDIGMPDEDGISLITRIRKGEQSPNIPAIALTSYASEDSKKKALKAGFQYHVSKPLEPSQLILCIQQLTSR